MRRIARSDIKPPLSCLRCDLELGFGLVFRPCSPCGYGGFLMVTLPSDKGGSVYNDPS